MTTILSERRYVARKHYTCDDCGRAIRPGNAYYATAAVVLGDFRTYRSHIARNDPHYVTCDVERETV